MPSRTIATTVETKYAIQKSCLEWGIDLKNDEDDIDDSNDQRSLSFVSKVTQQAMMYQVRSANDSESAISINHDDLIKLPRNVEDAIEHVYEHDLREYMDPNMFQMRLETENIKDIFEDVIIRDSSKGSTNNGSLIVQWPPKYIDKDGTIRMKKAFHSILQNHQIHDPFDRFQLLEQMFSEAELAFRQCNTDGWKNGYGFEAIVATNAIHKERCHCCKEKGTLVWCGGSDSSWRDLFCQSCQSCFEIKSKNDGKTIDKIFQVFNNLFGGSYRRWCEERFCKRRGKGRDYVVLVSREESSCLVDSGVAWAPLKYASKVEIAEIESVLPRLTAMSFVNYTQQSKENITLKSVVTLKNRTTWFYVEKTSRIDFDKILKRSFEKVFPNQWNKMAQRSQKTTGSSIIHLGQSMAKMNLAGTSRYNAWRNGPPNVGQGEDFSSRFEVGRLENQTNRRNNNRISKQGTNISSLNKYFEDISYHRESEYDSDGNRIYDNYDDYDDDYYIDSLTDKVTQSLRSSNGGSRNHHQKSNLCKHNGYKMNTVSGHYGKRRNLNTKKRGGRNKKYNYDDDY